jgi:hypothetical protein
MCPSCNQELTPIIYGNMSKEVIELINLGKIIYGGYEKPKDFANWYCLHCLEDITI